MRGSRQRCAQCAGRPVIADGNETLYRAVLDKDPAVQREPAGRVDRERNRDRLLHLLDLDAFNGVGGMLDTDCD